MANKEITTYQSIFRIGSVLSVSGREVKIKVDKQKNLPHIIYNGTLIRNISVGGYVKIINGFNALIAKIDGEFITVDDKTPAKDYSAAADRVYRALVCSLLGYLIPGKFVRGVKQLPLIDNECYILSNEEFRQIHCFVNSPEDQTITIGTLSSDEYTPISLGVQKLFSSHIGIFGNTGSGKSYTLAKLYRQLFLQYQDKAAFKKNSKFLFIDFNGEYSGKDAIVPGKQVYNLSTRTDKDKIPFSKRALLDLDTLCIFASATEKTQRPFISRCIEYYHHINDVHHFHNTLRLMVIEILQMSDNVKAEQLLDYVEQILPKYESEEGEERGLHTGVTFHNKMQYYYYGDTSNNLQGNEELIKQTLYYTQISKYKFPVVFIEQFIHIMYLRLIRDVLDNRAINEHIAPAINKLKSMVKDIARLIDFNDGDIWKGNNIVVINLNDVNQDSKKMIPLLLCNHLYKEHKAKKDEDLTYLNIVIDEAHNILSYQSNRESDTWKDYRLEVFEEIIKEGRKFGVFMTIASQRPSDISSTIVSQLHNYFIHRLVNDEDIEKVGQTISFLDKISKESLPILSTGVCIIAGQLVEMPIVVQIAKIEDENKPNNETIDVVSKWSGTIHQEDKEIQVRNLQGVGNS